MIDNVALHQTLGVEAGKITRNGINRYVLLSKPSFMQQRF